MTSLVKKRMILFIIFANELFYFVAILVNILFPHVYNSKIATYLIEIGKNVVPMLNNFTVVLSYNNFWGIVYTVVWLSAPVSIWLGWVVGNDDVLIKCKETLTELPFGKYVKNNWGEQVLLVVYLNLTLFLFAYPFYQGFNADYLDWRDNLLTSPIGAIFGVFVFTVSPMVFGVALKVLWSAIKPSHRASSS